MPMEKRLQREASTGTSLWEACSTCSSILSRPLCTAISLGGTHPWDGEPSCLKDMKVTEFTTLAQIKCVCKLNVSALPVPSASC